MNIEQVIQELEAEQSRIGKALQALKALRGATVSKHAAQPQRKKHTMSAASRRKISLAQKARWAKHKKG